MTAETDLHSAAATIRRAVAEFEAERLTNPYWSGVTFRQGVDGGLGGAGGKLAALMGDPGVAMAVAEWLDREARRVGSHAITTYKVREDWYAYACVTCGHSGSTSKAGLATWQEHHASVRPVADDAALAVAREVLRRDSAEAVAQ